MPIKHQMSRYRHRKGVPYRCFGDFLLESHVTDAKQGVKVLRLAGWRAFAVHVRKEGHSMVFVESQYFTGPHLEESRQVVQMAVNFNGEENVIKQKEGLCEKM